MTTPETSHPDTLRILVVDDDAVSRLLAGHVAREAGHEVTDAADAPSAREAIEAAPAPFDVIICDYSMPEESGLDLLASLEDPPPFVLLTGVGEVSELGDERTADITAFLTKPVQSGELLSTIDAVVNTGGGSEEE